MLRFGYVGWVGLCSRGGIGWGVGVGAISWIWAWVCGCVVGLVTRLEQ